MRNVLTVLLLLPAFFSFSQKNIELRSTLAYTGRLSNIWGYADTSGNEYALVGEEFGVSIVDVTNPDSIAELFFIPGPQSNWRELKTWNHHAYATNEKSDGLLIMDLSMLPDSVPYHYWNADSALGTAHTLYIDENGILYVFGYNNVEKNIAFEDRGALICDLSSPLSDPENPVVLGTYSADYVHDGFVRGDTLWASQIARGNFAVIDVTDKTAPVVYTTQETPSRYTHNGWLSNDGKYFFTTDERDGSFIAAYDVRDLGNISEVDRWQADPGSGLVPHNTHFLNNYLISSYYKYGINILDATDPAHLVEVGYYDTSPYADSAGFRGCWGVYPYLPSGTLLASDIETGLYVLTPEYKRACYLTGAVTDDSLGGGIADVSVEIMGTDIFDFTTAITGVYKTGAADSGSYDVRFYKAGCLPRIITNVELQPGIVTELNIAMNCTSYVSVSDVMPDAMGFAAYPTIFNQSTVIYYRLNANAAARTDLQVFDMNGRLLSTLQLPDREGEVQLGSDLAVGMYFLRLTNAVQSKTLKVVKN